jgi:Rrf2 family cysteine metabolism transcriptional repressor
MKFTSMFRYGLRALAVLAENYGDSPVSAKDISAKEGISPSFLEQLMAQLRRSGIIEGVRGPGGGFRLRRHPSEILISEVVEALEGPVLVAKCISCDGHPSVERCEKYDNCSAVQLLENLERDFTTILSKYSLSDLGAKTRSE